MREYCKGAGRERRLQSILLSFVRKNRVQRTHGLMQVYHKRETQKRQAMLLYLVTVCRKVFDSLRRSRLEKTLQRVQLTCMEEAIVIGIKR